MFPGVPQETAVNGGMWSSPFWLDFPLPFQVFAKLVLRADAAAFLVMDGVGAEIVRGGIVGTGRFLQRAQVGNGVAVAVQTPAHAGVTGRLHHFHSCRILMAGCAADAAVQVGHVVEIGVAGKAVDHDPAYRLSRIAGELRISRRAQGGDERAVRQDVLMAAQAGFGVRNAGPRGTQRGGVAGRAPHLQVPGVQFVGKAHGLHRGMLLYVKVEIIHPSQNQGENEHAQRDDAVKPSVGMGWKDVGHGA